MVPPHPANSDAASNVGADADAMATGVKLLLLASLHSDASVSERPVTARPSTAVARRKRRRASAPTRVAAEADLSPRKVAQARKVYTPAEVGLAPRSEGQPTRVAVWAPDGRCFWPEMTLPREWGGRATDQWLTALRNALWELHFPGAEQGQVRCVAARAPFHPSEPHLSQLVQRAHMVVHPVVVPVQRQGSCCDWGWACAWLEWRGSRADAPTRPVPYAQRNERASALTGRRVHGLALLVPLVNVHGRLTVFNVREGWCVTHV